jgi:predicted nucleic-acid-binding protein
VPAFDTNVLVSVLVGDDPTQTRLAERAFARHAKGRLSRLVRTRGVVFEDIELVESALESYRVGKAELPDYLIVQKAQSVGAELLTFDKRLARENGVTLL